MYSFVLLITFTAFVYICNFVVSLSPVICKCQQKLKNFLNKKTQANNDSAGSSLGVIYLIDSDRAH